VLFETLISIKIIKINTLKEKCVLYVNPKASQTICARLFLVERLHVLVDEPFMALAPRYYVLRGLTNVLFVRKMNFSSYKPEQLANSQMMMLILSSVRFLRKMKNESC
jgi:hypothetical protein